MIVDHQRVSPGTVFEIIYDFARPVGDGNFRVPKRVSVHWTITRPFRSDSPWSFPVKFS